ncbi:hypothetical protein ABRT01_16975 [Lentibacillus sp. L22]|uniref:hypothetical protein n=1 Tax=Lentibacillus sp. L22 TaxID=3163028 RepID=UPI0034677D10
MNSGKRRKNIKTTLIEYCKEAFHAVNLAEDEIKLRDFVQVLSKTGSENPRMIYAYHIALYLYNLDRGANPFNFLVIDTPNQQGQDEDNLRNIFSALNKLNNPKGQVIMGTERKTGYEEKANLINLKAFKKSLSKSGYNNHIELLKKIESE